MDKEQLRQALLQAFSEESPDLFAKAENAVFALESCNESERESHLDDLKRALHSLKGSASAIGRGDIRDVSHAMEDMIFAFSEENSFAPQLFERLHVGLGFLSKGIADPLSELDTSETLEILALPVLDHDQFSQNEQAKATSEEESVSEKDNDKTQTVIPEEKLLHDKQSEDVQENMDVSQEALLSDVQVEKTPRKIAENSDILINETIRVSVDKIESMQSTVGELVAIRLQQEDGLSKLSDIQFNVLGLNAGWRTFKHELNEIRKLLPNTLGSRFDSKIASFTNDIKGVQSQVFHLSKQMGNQTGQLSLLSDEMDGGLKAIRMMPLGPFLDSYRSVARDAASQLNKSVVLENIEKGIEVDRLILQKIKEPMLHIIRNCVSHGIESKEERKRLGKPENGHVTIFAELTGEFVTISISDDGRGINTQAVFDKALRLGLITADQEINQDEILDIITRPGFSTSDKADKVSGRGVGMDVVASTLAELGGSLELESTEGFGSCFTLRVPSSMATSQGLILQVGDQRFGIVLDTVERIVRNKLSELDVVEGKLVIYIDGEPISLTSLAGVIGIPQFEPKEQHVAKPIVLLKTGNQRLALMVDDIPGEIPMIIKTMGPQYDHIKVYSGGAILSDGAVLPVLDSRHLVNMVSNQHTVSVEQLGQDGEDSDDSAQEEMNDDQGVVIVVDDSITTRTLERNILEAAGYSVSVATDGVEALDLLMIEDNVSLLVTDLEMPRMNGLELCQAIRSGRYSHLPIIMVTSVGSEEEQKRGLDAGADAYIVKNDFQQETFLNTVRRLAL